MNVFNAVMPPFGAACVRVWRGRQCGVLENWKFLYVVSFTAGCRARKHVTM